MSDERKEPLWAELAVTADNAEERQRYLALSALYDRQNPERTSRLETALDELRQWDKKEQAL